MEALSKAKLKIFASLHLKKFRREHKLAIGEGKKVLLEAVAEDVEVACIILRDGIFVEELPVDISQKTCFFASEKDFDRLSTQVNPEGVLTIFAYPAENQYAELAHHADLPQDIQGPAFLLEDIRDPGNLGTILRTADWFGFKTVICSAKSVDAFNPKVIRSSMGSIFRLRLFYIEDFTEMVAARKDKIWLADMEGSSPEGLVLSNRPFILFGNEANGVSPEIRNIAGLNRITIPRLGGAESLNLGVSAGILAWEWTKS